MGRPNVVIAPDKFKGSLSAREAALAIKAGVLDAAPGANCEICPMADGGEGTVDAFLERGAVRKLATVHGPLGKPVEAAYALDGDAAVLEMASASGLALLAKPEYDPVRADTFGTGELILAALNQGAQRLIVGIGGSATNDAGTGMLRALGVRFFDENQHEIGGGSVLAYQHLKEIDLGGIDKRLASVAIEVASDVDSPLTGPAGAARTFAAQKGATLEQIELLDRTLDHIADVAAETLHHDDRSRPGAGAAGGLGFALLAFLRAKMVPGVQLIARECNLDKLLDGAALCLTGEGQIDEQTLHGKVVYGVGQLAGKRGVPVIAFAGSVEKAAAQRLAQLGIRVVQIAPRGTPVETSIREARRFLQTAATVSVKGVLDDGA